MMKIFFTLCLILTSANSFANGYVGADWGKSFYASDELKAHNVSTSGSTYGFMFGFKYQFMGAELLYQNLGSDGKIIHDGADYIITEKATALGAALRFHFDTVYLRFGLAKYYLHQSLNVPDGNSKKAAEVIYKIHPSDDTKNGSLIGIGLHHKLWSTTFLLDFTRYNISDTGHYDSITIGVLIPIPARFFEFSSK